MHLFNARNMEHIKAVTRTFLYSLFGRGNIIFNKVQYIPCFMLYELLWIKKNTTYFSIQIPRDFYDIWFKFCTLIARMFRQYTIKSFHLVFFSFASQGKHHGFHILHFTLGAINVISTDKHSKEIFISDATKFLKHDRRQ